MLISYMGGYLGLLTHISYMYGALTQILVVTRRLKDAPLWNLTMDVWGPFLISLQWMVAGLNLMGHIFPDPGLLSGCHANNSNE